MTDHFAVLRQLRRPWLDPDELKREYQQITVAYHPDRAGAAGPDIDFSSINEAYRVLSNPKLRLQHLVKLEGENPADASPAAATGDLNQIFMQTAALLPEIDAFLQKRERATTELSKSLLRGDAETLRTRVDQLLGQLQRLEAEAERDLRQTDEAWVNNRAKPLHEISVLAQRFGYLERWIGQLRERQFQLSS